MKLDGFIRPRYCLKIDAMIIWCLCPIELNKTGSLQMYSKSQSIQATRPRTSTNAYLRLEQKMERWSARDYEHNKTVESSTWSKMDA